MSTTPRILFVSALMLSLAVPAHAQQRRRDPPPPTAALAEANDDARRRPDAQSFVDATQIYDFAPGALYELYAAPEFLSTILLEEGETLQTTAAGDTTRWMVEAVAAAGGEAGRTLVLVKPTRSDIRTNIVLVTDRRTYLIEAIAVDNAQGRPQTYSAQIAWRYPDEGPRTVAPPSVALDALNLDYRIEVVRGRRPVWVPERVFDDGRRTFIEFPDAVQTDQAPPLFVMGPEGPELVNYRVVGTRYVVDQLFAEAELRLGDRRPVIVRLTRENPPSAAGASP
jgi:type IV secretion system protein VirB9